MKERTLTKKEKAMGKKKKAAAPAPLEERKLYEILSYVFWPDSPAGMEIQEEGKEGTTVVPLDDMTDEQVGKELRESLKNLYQQDEQVVKTKFADIAEQAWGQLKALYQEVFGTEIPVGEAAPDTPPEEAATDVKQTKPDPAAPNPGGKDSAGSKKKGSKKGAAATATKGDDAGGKRDEFGFLAGSLNSHFMADLAAGPKTMKEIREAPWNSKKASFYNLFKKLVADGKAVKDKDGKMALKKK